MPIKFKINNGTIVITPQILLFEEFGGIYKKDKTSKKRSSLNILKYVFLMCDLTKDNPLCDVDVSNRKNEALKLVYGSSDIEFSKIDSAKIKNAVELYNFLNSTAEERLLTTFDEKITQIRNELDTTLPETYENDKDGVISYTSNISIITKGLKELDFIKKLKSIVLASIKKEAMTNRVRGMQKLSPMSRGLMDLKPYENRFNV